LRNFRAAAFGDKFGGKGLAAVNFIAAQQQNLTLGGYGKI
jgi:hypothetical protein